MIIIIIKKSLWFIYPDDNFIFIQLLRKIVTKPILFMF